MKFWDSSAVVPLLVAEPSTEAATRLYRDDPAMVVWWGTPLECASALARREREGSLDPGAVTEALGRLAAVESAWHEVLPSDRLRAQAVRLVRVHPLRAADALQLAAALAVAEGNPERLPFVTLDGQLALAAEREGFPVARPGEAG
ncbi:MAG: hypothetical protein KatS3mg065_0090 [Chloroflexota bacterium]|nr:MAG: hypothetical protein KatS3mg065_0090 [Chloroflexota bacterium]